MSRFVEAKSDQLNADDLIGNPRTITITRVIGCDGDQPIAIHYEGDNGKPFKPCKTIRRVLLAVWGRNAADYVGRSMTLYRDDAVMFGGLNVGGIRISHMSNIDKKTVVVVMKTKGKKAGIEVNPLTVAQPETDWPGIAANTIANIGKAPDLAKLDQFIANRMPKLSGMSEAAPEQWQAVDDALRLRRADFSAVSEPVTDTDLPDGF
jgi:hypothetical protein